MTSSINEQLNVLDVRVSELEQVNTRPTRSVTQVATDPDTETPYVEEVLDWSIGGWESYSQIAIVTNPADPDYIAPGEPGYPYSSLSTPYGQAEAHMVGYWCLLTGLVRRKTGNLAASTHYAIGTGSAQPMFALPLGWRPINRAILPCLMGNADPTGTGVAAPTTGWVEVRPEETLDSGRVYYVAGGSALTAGVGWVALQGAFPCRIVVNEPDIVENSWDDTENWLTWDDVEDGITWNSWPEYPPGP